MIIPSASADDRIRLIAIEMKGAFGNEGALRLSSDRIWKPGIQEEREGIVGDSVFPGFLVSRFNSDLIPVRFQIFHPGVAHDRDDCRARSELLGQSQSGDDISPGGSAGE